ncbi:MFS transporter [Myxococcota bacterium]|nr:MFS transporter [Myxococcota bacterium]
MGDIRGRAMGVVIGGLTAQLGLGCMYLSSVLTPAMLEELGFSRGDFMLAGTPRTVVAALASPMVGALTQRYGSRPVIIGGLLLLGTSYSLFAFVQDLWHVFAISMAVGLVVAGVGDIAVGTVVSKWVHRARGLALGIVYSGSNLGGLICSILGAWLLLTYGWRNAYLIVGISSMIILIPVVWRLVREPEDVADLPAPADSPGNANGDGEYRESESAEVAIEFSEAVRTRDFWILAFALFFFFFYYIGVNGNLVLFLTDLGIPIEWASASFGATVFLGVTAKVGIGLMGDRWPAKIALLVNFFAVTLASYLLLAIPMTGILPLFILLHGCSTAAQNVVYPLIVAERFGTATMAKIYGTLMLALLPGGMLGPVFAGYLFDATGSYDLAFQIFAVLNTVGLIALCTVKNRAVARTLPES